MISIIIPVYNEENIIQETLAALPYKDNLEVIVVDGGSLDRTVEIAKGYPVKVILGPKNRALQMNMGAEAAKGEAFLFLHADCALEAGSLGEIQGYLGNGCVGGCLRQRINSGKLIYRAIEASGNIRARLSKVFYGDQAIFVRRDVFFKVGGFDNIPIFEDIFFSKKLKKAGQTKVLDKKVFVSPRRWEKNGIIKTTFIYWLLTIGLRLNFSIDTLKRIYYDVR